MMTQLRPSDLCRAGNKYKRIRTGLDAEDQRADDLVGRQFALARGLFE
jgi:hypothetical protein